MSALEKMNVDQRLLEVIQDSLPNGQEIRHLAPIIRVVGPDWNLQYEEFYLAVTDALVAARGVGWNGELMPQIKWSKDCLIGEFVFAQYSEAECPDELVAVFGSRGHQTRLIAEADLSINGLEFTVFTFFSELADIYAYVREKKLESFSRSGTTNSITKCQGCGSTELTVQGSHLVCGYCQTKYVR